MKLKNPITISIRKDDVVDFKKDKLVIKDKVTIFVAPNGYGKTTLMGQIQHDLKKQGIPEAEKGSRHRDLARAFRRLADTTEDEIKPTAMYVTYDAHADQQGNVLSSAIFEKNYERFALRQESSEGQNKLISMMEVFDTAAEIANENDELETIIMIVDGIDSGLSVDMIELIMKTLNHKIKQVEQFGVDVALILTTNNYEMCRNNIVRDPLSFEEFEYHDYEHFRKDMLQKTTLD